MERHADLAAAGLHHSPSIGHLVDPKLWELFLEGSEIVRAKEGESLDDTGSGRPIVAILDGVVRIFITAPGGKQVTMRYGRTGDVAGIAAAMLSTSSPSLEAVADATVARMSIEHVRSLAAAHPELAWAIAVQMAGWAADLALNMAEVEHRPVTARVAGHLVELATMSPGGTMTARASHQHLADAVGTAREVVTRCLRQLRELGVVETSARTVVITDWDRLARIARGNEQLA